MPTLNGSLSWLIGEAAARQRRAVTLLELMLVLAVMVAVGAIVLPALRGPLEDQRLRKAADLILAQWIQARLEALTTGRMQVFRYQSGTDQYEVQAWYSEGDLLESPADEPEASAKDIDPRDLQRPSMLGVAGLRLPDGVTFFFGETPAEARMIQSGIESAAAAGNSADPPIVFYPDGTATHARLILTNERFFVELSLRGLTGLGRVSQLLSAEEIER